ncbi:unnamed protein product, partial [Rotaria magnacalcarata]
NIPVNATLTQNGVTIAGGKGSGSATNKLFLPQGIFVDDDQTVVIADWCNHRIMQWKKDATINGQLVADSKRQGNGLHQLNRPTDVLIDKDKDSLIICDYRNRRVVQWSRRSGTTQGAILIDNIDCWGLAMDEHRYLYVSDMEKHEIRRYQLGEKNSTLVTGGNGRGSDLNQLTEPTYLFIDRQQNVYISDRQSQGNALTQLYYPYGLIVDMLGTLYVADHVNHRVMRWTQGTKLGTVIVGGNGRGTGANQFAFPFGLSFDRHGNLYVVDRANDRVQRFSIE